MLTLNTQPSDNKREFATCTWKQPKEPINLTNCGKKLNLTKTTKKHWNKLILNFFIGHPLSFTNANKDLLNSDKCLSKWENLNYKEEKKLFPLRKKHKEEIESDKLRLWLLPTLNKKLKNNWWKDLKLVSTKIFTTTIQKYSTNWSEDNKKPKKKDKASTRKMNKWNPKNNLLLSNLTKSMNKESLLKTSTKKSSEKFATNLLKTNERNLLGLVK